MSDYDPNLMHPAFLHPGDTFRVVGQDGPPVTLRSGRTNPDGSVRLQVRTTNGLGSMRLGPDSLVEVVQ